MDGLTLRPADAGSAADADAVTRIHLASRAVAAMPPGIHPPHEVRSYLHARLATDDVWLAELDGTAVGYARLTPTWLDDLYVVPEAAGTGVGSALLDLAKSLRPGGFCLWVFEMNTPARAFYAKHGLVELERTDGSTNEERSPDLRLAWPGGDPMTFFRGLIDDVDSQLGDLLARRAALTRAVQPHKAAPERDPRRERAHAPAAGARHRRGDGAARPGARRRPARADRADDRHREPGRRPRGLSDGSSGPQGGSERGDHEVADQRHDQHQRNHPHPGRGG